MIVILKQDEMNNLATAHLATIFAGQSIKPIERTEADEKAKEFRFEIPGKIGKT